jgi:mannose-6-phosphate isomerase-like protein (cupin superfamily)
MIINNIYDLLNNAMPDSGIGIKLRAMTGNKDLTVFAIELNHSQSIPAHYHKQGIETYQILTGQGKISIGNIIEGKLIWQEERNVHEGDCFSVQPSEVHKLQNIAQQSLQVIGCSSIAHSNEDRYFVNE